MSDLGLLMTDPMALACHEGRKTVTRRPMSPQPPARDVHGHPLQFKRTNEALEVWCSGGFMNAIESRIPGAGTAKVGGRVWIRECWTPVDGDGWGLPRGAKPIHEHPLSVVYRASAGDSWKFGDCTWRPSIHMPKWACRTWGIIVSVRPERLQDITDDDARREGFKPQHPGGLVSLPPSCKAAFVATWNGLYEPRGLGWNANPWVWRIEWERIERPGDL